MINLFGPWNSVSWSSPYVQYIDRSCRWGRMVTIAGVDRCCYASFRLHMLLVWLLETGAGNVIVHLQFERKEWSRPSQGYSCIGGQFTPSRSRKGMWWLGWGSNGPVSRVKCRKRGGRALWQVYGWKQDCDESLFGQPRGLLRTNQRYLSIIFPKR